MNGFDGVRRIGVNDERLALGVALREQADEELKTSGGVDG